MVQMIKSRQWESSLDGISKLKLSETLIPLPARGEVLVKVNSVSLNYKDGETIEGQFKHHKAMDVAGSIVPCSE
jgi:NADPH:quinone reductase-like Zn-dependent oxidoreductase